MTMLPQGKEGAVADAGAGNWVDRFAPAALLPYLRLARADRPVGFSLLAFPCFWSVALAGRSLDEAYPDLKASGLFLDLQKELTQTEERIALARDYFNQIVTFYNTRLEIIPDRFLAKMMGLRPRLLMSAADFERAPVRVDLAS